MILKDTKQLIKENDFFIKKKFGQNFLIDKNIIEKITKGSNISKNDIVLEIGPGLGALTSYLSKKCKKLICVEIDKTLIPILKNKNFENVEIIEGDILDIDICSITNNQNIKVVANLPYYISTPIITKLLEMKNVSSITIMIQKEVADRLKAKKSTKEYGSLTVFVKYHSKVTFITNVSPDCFLPKPTVESTVLHFEREKKYFPDNEDFFYKVVRAGFSQRRKTLINSIFQNNLGITKENVYMALKEMNFDENIRGDNLDVEDYVLLSNKLFIYNL
ncbi:MAG: 16S rRNA (adenine(1518)-N(6)/adenine(1519)-N(6))-dimethyltransferase RsmA [Defluviitaleaceae bacterium]|nr:16S rRNA (adenine(1518)-N(6)/adenine(1519)-N(6))-dimethyltransferase RsmA [Defluviitaleaceae bacterium]